MWMSHLWQWHLLNNVTDVSLTKMCHLLQWRVAEVSLIKCDSDNYFSISVTSRTNVFMFFMISCENVFSVFKRDLFRAAALFCNAYRIVK